MTYLTDYVNGKQLQKIVDDLTAGREEVICIIRTQAFSANNAERSTYLIVYETKNKNDE